jgi:hypothetical protein
MSPAPRRLPKSSLIDCGVPDVEIAPGTPGLAREARACQWSCCATGGADGDGDRGGARSVVAVENGSVPGSEEALEQLYLIERASPASNSTPAARSTNPAGRHDRNVDGALSVEVATLTEETVVCFRG